MGANIFWRFDSDAITPTATSATTDNPVTNIQVGTLSALWESDATNTTDRITFDFTTATAITAFSVFGHNALDADTFQVEYADDVGFTTNQGTEAVTKDSAKGLAYFTSVSRRFWRFNWVSAGTTAKRAGRVVLGTHTALGVSTHEPGFTMGQAEATTRTVRTEGGQLYADLGVTLEQMGGIVPGVIEAERLEIDTLADTYSTAIPFVASFAPTAHLLTKSIYGTLMQLPAQTSVTDYMYSLGFRMVEQK